MTTLLLPILLALLPVILLIMFIQAKDKLHPEPAMQLVKAFFAGVLTLPISLLFYYMLLGSYECAETVGGQIMKAFVGAAIPEESAKLLVLWLVLRKNRFFDEHLDGIVYAVMVGLGFAAIENILYVLFKENWIAVGIVRSLLAVPAHYIFAVFMGYFYTKAYFARDKKWLNYALALFVPIVLHGVYDMLLLVGGVLGGCICVMLFVMCCVMCYFLHKAAYERIKLMAQSDMIIMLEPATDNVANSSDNVEYIEYEENNNANKE